LWSVIWSPAGDFRRNLVQAAGLLPPGFPLKMRFLPIVAGAMMATSISDPGLACAALTAGPKGRVTEVVDGDTVILDSGVQVRLIGMQAPKLPLGRDDFVTWPGAPEAKRFLEALVLGQQV
jgi:micrococcal nuclease